MAAIPIASMAARRFRRMGFPRFGLTDCTHFDQSAAPDCRNGVVAKG